MAEKDLSRVAVFGKLREDRQDKPTILGTSTLHSLKILFFTTAKVEIDLDPAREIVLEREINKTRPDLSLSAENSNFLSYLTDQSGPSISFSPIHFNQKIMFDRIVYTLAIRI